MLDRLESYTVSVDKRYYTYHPKKGITFQRCRIIIWNSPKVIILYPTIDVEFGFTFGTLFWFINERRIQEDRVD